MWRNPPATTSTRPTQSRTISQIVSAWPSLVTTPLSIAYLTTSGAATAPACQNRPELTAPRTPPDCERTTSRTKRQAEPRRSSASPMALTYPPPEGAFRRQRLTHAVGRGTSSCDDPQGAHPSRAFAGSARSGVRDGRRSCGGHHGAQRRVRLQRLPRGLDGDGRRPPGRHLADARGRGRRADDHARPQLVGRRRAGLLPPQGGARRLQGDGADQGDRDTERAADGELVAFRLARAAGDRQCRERELGRLPQRPGGRSLGARAQDDPRQPLGPGARSHPARLDRAPNLARVGPRFVLLRRLPGRSWKLHWSYSRADLPARLQVGVDAFSGYDDTRADLVSHVDFVRFAPTGVPPKLKRRFLAGRVGLQTLVPYLSR